MANTEADKYEVLEKIGMFQQTLTIAPWLVSGIILIPYRTGIVWRHKEGSQKS